VVEDLDTLNDDVEEEQKAKIIVKYLPSPRSKDNPNARGGATHLQPKAPNARLDPVAIVEKDIKNLGKLSLFDIMVNMGFINPPKVAEGKPRMPKRVTKWMMVHSLQGIFKVQELHKLLFAYSNNSPDNIVTAANPFTDLPSEYWLEANQNLVMRYQM